ncbi:hypothetical protein HDU76_009681 [Blyttiomyces sp. JEL0837]|nr:hypothetical protein HDU76_009681 [Blyttiomyces sp. JEL0837]
MASAPSMVLGYEANDYDDTSVMAFNVHRLACYRDIISHHRQSEVRLFALETLFLSLCNKGPMDFIKSANTRIDLEDTTVRSVFHMTLADLRSTTTGFGLRRVVTSSIGLDDIVDAT